MKLYGILLQAGIIVLLAYGTPSEANGKALKQWVDCATQWDVLTQGIRSAFEFEEVAQNVFQSTQRAEVTVIGNERYTELQFYLEEQGTDLESKTNFLHYLENQAAFLQVNRAKWGNWFGTVELGGCDVWIAVHQDYDPFIVHINANRIPGGVDNLRYKDLLAADALDYFNVHVIKEEDKYYHFNQRISYDYAKDLEGTAKDEVDEYWNNFQVSHPEIPYKLYYVDKSIGQRHVFFYGVHDTCYYTGAWNFALKEIPTGEILLRLSCSTEYLYCTIQ